MLRCSYLHDLWVSVTVFFKLNSRVNIAQINKCSIQVDNSGIQLKMVNSTTNCSSYQYLNQTNTAQSALVDNNQTQNNQDLQQRRQQHTTQYPYKLMPEFVHHKLRSTTPQGNLTTCVWSIQLTHFYRSHVLRLFPVHLDLMSPPPVSCWVLPVPDYKPIWIRINKKHLRDVKN